MRKFNIAFPTEAAPWPTEGLRRMSINSFGVGGSNAHLILEDAYNYLESRNIKGVHHTVPKPPSKEEVQGLVTRLLALEEDTTKENGKQMAMPMENLTEPMVTQTAPTDRMAPPLLNQTALRKSLQSLLTRRFSLSLIITKAAANVLRRILPST